MAYIRENHLLHAGDRIGIAVSGGADSVALLRFMLELREELGIMVSALHFNHCIRGDESEGDEKFVVELAYRMGLETHLGKADAPARAAQTGQSLETAARELRYDFFREQLKNSVVDRIATAHTEDDQAETVLMRLIRGAGTRGLAGIYPRKDDGRLIRPFLAVRRCEIEAYLNCLKQDWRDDSSNQSVLHSRNRIRHELLPLLAKDYNPAIVEVLARTAEVARCEEDYWTAEASRLLPMMILPGKPVRGGGRRTSKSETIGFSIETLQKQHPALRRRLIRLAAESLGCELDANHVEQVIRLAEGSGKATDLPGGWRASKSFREIRLEKSDADAKVDAGYEHPLVVPGTANVSEINSMIHVRLERVTEDGEGYNSPTESGGMVLEGDALTRLTLRNWRPGDRYRQAHSSSEKKVKDLLQELKVPSPQRSLWPVVVAGDMLVWMRGTRPRPVWVRRQDSLEKLVIEMEDVKDPV